MDTSILIGMSISQLTEIEDRLKKELKRRKNTYVKPIEEQHLKPLKERYIIPLQKQHLKPIKQVLREIKKLKPDKQVYVTLNGTRYGPMDKKTLKGMVTEVPKVK